MAAFTTERSTAYSTFFCCCAFTPSTFTEILMEILRETLKVLHCVLCQVHVFVFFLCSSGNNSKKLGKYSKAPLSSSAISLLFFQVFFCFLPKPDSCSHGDANTQTGPKKGVLALLTPQRGGKVADSQGVSFIVTVEKKKVHFS